MTSRFWITFLISAALANPVKAIAQPVPLPEHSSNPSARLYDDSIIVKYKETSLQAADPSQRKSKMNDIASGIFTQHGLTPVRTMPTLGIHQFRVPPGKTLNNIIVALRKNPHVEFADYNYLAGATQAPPLPKEPTDYLWTHGKLWGLKKIQMPNAWGYETDASKIIVAVIDSGIDHSHDDLKQNMWTNPATGIKQGFNYCVDKDNPTLDTTDLDGHGTQVAGIIGAAGNNTVSNNSGNDVGVAWSVQMMSLKWLCGKDPNTGLADGEMAAAEAAIEDSITLGATIINNSWRILDQVAESDIPTLKAAVLRTNCQVKDTTGALVTISGCKPALFVAAAGNWIQGDSLNSDNSNGKVYPANFTGVSNIISVAATDCLDDPLCTDTLWFNSHYGPNTVHIAAPGNNIQTTFPVSLGGSTTTFFGTSAATPHVSGCAALLQARKLAKTGTLLSIAEIKDLLFNNADSTVRDPKDPTNAMKFGVIGGRRLNCAKAMAAVPVPVAPDITPPAAPIELTIH